MMAPKRQNSVISDELSHALRLHLDFAGAISFHRVYSDAPNPCLVLSDLGSIGLPLNPREAEIIKSRAEQYPFGTGEQTIIEKSARDMWQINADMVKFENPAWESWLKPVVHEICQTLDVHEAASRPKCELQKLLLYEAGSHLLPHVHTDKADRVFATVVIILPSKFTGGSTHVSYESMSADHDCSETSDVHTSVMAWYTNVAHEVKPLVSGYRLALSFNLIHTTAAPRPAPSTNNKVVAPLRKALLKWKADAGLSTPDKILYLLEYEYPQANLRASTLKGADAQRTAILRMLGEEVGFCLGLATVECHTTGVADEGRRSHEMPTWYCDTDVSSECSDTWGFDEIYGSKISITNFVDLDGESIDSKLKLDRNTDTAPEHDAFKVSLRSGVHYKQEVDHYSAFEAAMLERWYRRSVLVIWPKYANGIVTNDIDWECDNMNDEIDESDVATDELRTQVNYLLNRAATSWWDSSYLPEVICYAACQWDDIQLWNKAVDLCVEKKGLKTLDVPNIGLAIETFGFEKVKARLEMMIQQTPTHSLRRGEERGTLHLTLRYFILERYFVSGRYFSTQSTAPTPRKPVSHSSTDHIPDVEEIRRRCQEVFGKRACLWQAEFTRAILARKTDVVLEVATGMGKSLAFWLPVLFVPRGIQIIVTALNVLGQQNVEFLASHGISAVSIDGSLEHNQMKQAFVDLEVGKHRVLIISPEQLMKANGPFDPFFKKPEVQDNIISITFDEAHFISVWGELRPEYRDVGRLRYRLRRDIPFAIVSATLPPAILKDIAKVLHLRHDKLTFVTRSTDRPNIFLAVHKLVHPASSYLDLAMILPKERGQPPPKFIIFFNTVKKAMAATKVLWRLIGKEHSPEDRIKWFCSQMSEEYKKREIERFKAGELWGLCATEACGTGMDLRDVFFIGIYEAEKRDACGGWQKFGRGVRDAMLQGVAVLFTEAKFFDEDRERARKAAEVRAAKRKRAAADGHGKQTVKRRMVTAVGAEWVPGEIGRVGAGEEDDNEDLELEAGADVVDEDEALRERYALEGPNTVKKKREVPKLDQVLDDFINAGTRASIGCRRKPFTFYFNMDKAKAKSDHLLCDPTSPTGCSRCTPKAPTKCCDLHPGGKEYLDSILPRARLPEKSPKAPARSRLRKYQCNGMDYKLSDVLHDWRVAKTIEEFDEGTYHEFGASLVLPDDTMDRIVDCAHFNKVASVADLLRETKNMSL
ncbi:hypothetical protein NM688_g6715 [Phlebia brevispora]|uniref:Uncharacterized protein n=1 Tax=Phlebia brevispora TaxID=194682 RepID=A0ACC1SD68_9APHY|nr:hypothetical protein NM688_g6715 [Phlebia brevispora]